LLKQAKKSLEIRDKSRERKMIARETDSKRDGERGEDEGETE
jgi:hypothetical protein